MKKTKIFSLLSFICMAATAFWVVLMVISALKSGPINTMGDAIESVSSASTLYYVSYINAFFITIFCTILYTCLYAYCKPAQPELALIGFVFVPIYSLINIVVYLSQVTVVPVLYDFYYIADYYEASRILLAQTIHQSPGSAMGLFNSLAYALLGIPSITFGIVIFKKGKAGIAAGLFLILNAIACILGAIGFAVKNNTLGMGTAVGGVLFLIALFFLTIMFLKDRDS
ncbi:MAG: DUF4386 family protein [bacterium]|nr:DUF4386 family protein [bacterium]